jgi:hypothetical protein
MLVVFSWSAWIVVCCGVLFALVVVLSGGQYWSFPVSDIVGWTGFTAICAIGIAILVIIFGMAIHCLFNGELSIGTKIIWSIFAGLTAPFGAAIYFFAVYKKQTEIHREAMNV